MTTHKNTKQHTISKLFAIALLLALAPLFISTAYAWSDDDNHHHGHHAPPPLEGVNKYKYKVGDRGPGGGFIFFVDYYDQYRGFTYLEAAPTDIAPVVWCSNTTTSIPAVAGWSANAVGRGRANTKAMIGVCTSGAANEADSYLTATKSDWFLPSEGELMLMYTNLRQAGVGGFADNGYWSSSEFGSNTAWHQYFYSGGQYDKVKNGTLPVRAVRAF
jgi:hypothetical protein